MLAVTGALAFAAAASAGGWSASVAYTNQVASTPFTGGGYPVPPGATAPLPGTCRAGSFNSNQRSSASFIGDYFGLAISQGNIYALNVSTHYPAPRVRADNGGRVYYQQQVLATVPRSDFGAGF